MAVSSADLLPILANADRVRILGLVPLDLDWDALASAWRTGGRSRRIEILSESDNMLFEHSLLTDTEFAPNRRSYRDLRFARQAATNALGDLLPAGNGGHKNGGQTNSAITFEVLYLRPAIVAVQADAKLFVSDWLTTGMCAYSEVESGADAFVMLEKYLDLVFNEQVGRKYAAHPDEEVLELYDHDRIPRGIFPRRSFYDTDFSQLVIWGLVFDRSGRLLIHRRSDNAKDNQSMWDKSVGGHVDFHLDVDTSRAMSRELLEELFTDENKAGTDITAFSVDDQDVVFLGEWRPERRRAAPFGEISGLRREWSYFRLRHSEQVYSPRTLAKGGVRRLRVIADVFLFVAGPRLTDESLGRLQNSQFKLLELSELKTAMDRALRGDEVAGFEEQNTVPKFTPDLVNIMTGRLRDVLEEFAQHIKRYVRRLE